MAGKIVVSEILSDATSSNTVKIGTGMTLDLNAQGTTVLPASIPAANLTGALPAISGASLTNLPAGVDNTPSFMATVGTSFNVSTDTWTAMALNSEQWDTDSAYDTSNYRFTVPAGEAGKYLFTYSAATGFTTGPSASEYLLSRIWKNGSPIGNSLQKEHGTGADNVFDQGAYTMELSVGDYVQLYIFQNSGQTEATNAGYGWFSGMKISGV
jgi:hypothetical protein